MADKIHSYYLKAEEMGGVNARAKLSMLTMVDSYQARVLPDSEENIRLFEQAMKQLIKDYNAEQADSSIRLKLLKLLLIRQSA